MRFKAAASATVVLVLTLIARADVVLTPGPGLYSVGWGSNQQVDFTGDGQPEFTVHLDHSTVRIVSNQLGAGVYALDGKFEDFPVAFALYAEIGPETEGFQYSNDVPLVVQDECHGWICPEWLCTVCGDAFIGVRFDADGDGDPNYGWIHVLGFESVVVPYLGLLAWGYETVESTPVLAGASDCDGDGVMDADEVMSGAESDCNTNGMIDGCEVALGYDCNGNGIPDSCDIVGGAPDCDGNLIPDECDLASGSQDCNGNGVVDACDISAGAPDCNGNLVPDECEKGLDDCNNDGIPDACGPGNGDCDGDGTLDVCAVTAGALDCNGNLVPDSCEPDCDGDGLADACEIASGAELDCDGNGVPDSCERPTAFPGSALDFDGDADFVYIVGFPTIQSDYTIGAWLFLREPATHFERPAVLSDPCQTGAEFMIRGEDHQGLELGHCNVYNGTLSAGAVPTLVWVHVAVSVSSDKIVSYFIDGQLAGSWSAAGLPTPIPGTIALGGNGTDGRWLDGLLDEVTVWSPAHSAEQVADWFDDQLVGNEPGLVAYWPMDEGAGSTVNDIAGGHDGAIVGDAAWSVPGVPASADLNDDGAVNGADLALMLGRWGTCGCGCVEDLTGDGQVDGSDLAILLGAWS